jgi:hypothetical protein
MTAPTLGVQLPALTREHGGPTSAVWREQAIAEADQTQFALESLAPHIDDATQRQIMASLNMVRAAATDTGLKRFARLRSAFGGASIERAWGAIDAANEALLRAAPPSYLIGQLPRIKSRVEGALGRDDMRRTELAALSLTSESDVTPVARELVASAFHSANGEERRKYTRVRSFRNMLHLCGIFLTIAAIGLAVLGWTRPDLALLCFQPSGQAVCPTQVISTLNGGVDATGQPAPLSTRSVAERDEKTRAAASPIDLLLVELIGLVAAALAAATALRRLHGTSTPFSIPLALALLKLPSGALTAALGLLLMRADFVPGLSALDTPAQIIGWAVIFGYAQELFTRFVDQRAQTVISTGGATPSPNPGVAPENR